VVSFSTLAFNVVANLILIPRFGIVGAAAASLVAYSFSALLNTAIAARLTQTRVRDFWIPSADDIRYVAATIADILRRLRHRSHPLPGSLES
jgi:O-antigen/teichoic acid export membrane protein